MHKTLLQDYIDRNPDSIVQITHESESSHVSLKGILSTPQLTQSMSPNFGQGVKEIASRGSSILGDFIQSATGGRGKKMRALGTVAKGATQAYSEYLTNSNTVMGSIKLYEGSDEVRVPIDMVLFYDLMSNPSYKQMDYQLNLLSQPRLLTGGIFASNLYSNDELKKVFSLDQVSLKGKLPTVSIGNNYSAKDVYLSGFSKGHSTILDEFENPVAMHVSFTISPYKQLTAEELSAWILGGH